ncbi:MAG: hypothetical protein LBV17_05130 [Treponema sp.]|jgi:hypothetical protein|nr:hypothetical protein [Treponema sp.]
MRKKNLKQFLFYSALALILCTCNDPIFYIISKEVKPIEPLIKGVATNFAVYNGSMYVASGSTLHVYKKDGENSKAWRKEAQPGGNILQIASTGNNLYALCSADQNNNGRAIIKLFNKENSSWTEIGGIDNSIERIHDIFAVNNTLFIMVSYSIYYSVLYIDNSGTINELNITEEGNNGTGEINGIAFNGVSYFISSKSMGVYKINNISEGASLIKYKDENGDDVKVISSGIINLQDADNTIVIITRNGDLYTVKDSITRIENVSMGKMATGALAIWRENNLPESNRLLLAGRQDSLKYTIDSGYTYGYMELELDTTGIKSGKTFVEPGKELLSSIRQGGNERYQSTIGKNPINYLFQVPYEIDSNMLLFASTQKNGVWSYKERKGEFQWNAEDEE